MTETQDVTALLERITELETRVAFQDDVIDKLDGVVCEFSEKMALLQGRLEALNGQIEAMGSSDGEIGPANDPPPHY